MPKPDTVTSRMILRLIEQQKFRCALSNRELTPETASLDHRVPLSRGGEHSLANIWIVDHQVNAAKGTLTPEEFVLMCRDVVTYADAGPPPP